MLSHGIFAQGSLDSLIVSVCEIGDPNHIIIVVMQNGLVASGVAIERNFLDPPSLRLLADANGDDVHLRIHPELLDELAIWSSRGRSVESFVPRIIIRDYVESRQWDDELSA